ncbi:hypothetical protein [Leptospira interrogans]|uniref:hypothetical protein n=1 Tax=Leptospira interrogans TaxID=173 RepID=UPI000774070E|nr:hypothetical protein [Leptospira interrogans]
MQPQEIKPHTSFVLGEAVRDKTTGQRMYVDTTWDGKVPCVYFDAEKRSLVKVEIAFEDLEKMQCRNHTKGRKLVPENRNAA